MRAHRCCSSNRRQISSGSTSCKRAHSEGAKRDHNFWIEDGYATSRTHYGNRNRVNCESDHRNGTRSREKHHSSITTGRLGCSPSESSHHGSSCSNQSTAPDPLLRRRCQSFTQHHNSFNHHHQYNHVSATPSGYDLSLSSSEDSCSMNDGDDEIRSTSSPAMYRSRKTNKRRDSDEHNDKMPPTLSHPGGRRRSSTCDFNGHDRLTLDFLQPPSHDHVEQQRFNFRHFLLSKQHGLQAAFSRSHQSTKTPATFRANLPTWDISPLYDHHHNDNDHNNNNNNNNQSSVTEARTKVSSMDNREVSQLCSMVEKCIQPIFAAPSLSSSSSNNSRRPAADLTTTRRLIVDHPHHTDSRRIPDATEVVFVKSDGTLLTDPCVEVVNNLQGGRLAATTTANTSGTIHRAQSANLFLSADQSVTGTTQVADCSQRHHHQSHHQPIAFLDRIRVRRGHLEDELDASFDISSILNDYHDRGKLRRFRHHRRGRHRSSETRRPRTNSNNVAKVPSSSSLHFHHNSQVLPPLASWDDTSDNCQSTSDLSTNCENKTITISTTGSSSLAAAFSSGSSFLRRMIPPLRSRHHTSN